jgi:hypothetical protein
VLFTLVLFGGLVNLPFNSWVNSGWMAWPALVTSGYRLLAFYRALQPYRIFHSYGVFPPHSVAPMRYDIYALDTHYDLIVWTC